MNILITGACGYVGSSLTPYLLSQGHNIRAVDTEWFGNNLDPHPNLEFTKKDIRDLDETFFQNIESVIHLANIANDPSVELNPNLVPIAKIISALLTNFEATGFPLGPI